MTDKATAEEAWVLAILAAMPCLAPAGITRVLNEAVRLKEKQTPWREIEHRQGLPLADDGLSARLLLMTGTVVNIYGIPVTLDSPTLVLAKPGCVARIYEAQRKGAAENQTPQP